MKFVNSVELIIANKNGDEQRMGIGNISYYLINIQFLNP